MYGIVYLIWNLVNGKKYVGQTTKTVKERFREHPQKNSLIGNAIRNYGEENFRYGVIKRCASKMEMDKWEKYFIAMLRCKAPIGYNKTTGGSGTLGYSPTPEHCAKLAAANKGKRLTADTCAKIAAANVGKHHTAATRSKMAVSHRHNSPFKNLLNELDTHQLTYTVLAKLLELSITSVSMKMQGNAGKNI